MYYVNERPHKNGSTNVSVCLYLEDLEAIDVEDSDVQILLVLLHGFINTLSHTDQ